MEVFPSKEMRKQGGMMGGIAKKNASLSAAFPLFRCQELLRIWND